MNNKLLIGLVAVIIIIVVGLVALGGSKNQTQTSNAPQTIEQRPTTPPAQNQSIQKTEDATVTVDSSGFSPSTLTIKAGTKVVWANKSGSDISVNSDEHPVHRLNPQFNPGSVSNGSSISFTFDKPGTYPYHDHFNPSHTGTVVVE